MNKVLFTCEACNAQGRIPGEFRGKTVRCPTCKHVQLVPIDAPAPPSTGSTERIATPLETSTIARPIGDDRRSTEDYPQPGAQRTPTGELVPGTNSYSRMPPSPPKRIATPAVPMRVPTKITDVLQGDESVSGKALLNLLERVEQMEARHDQLQGTVARVANTSSKSSGPGAEDVKSLADQVTLLGKTLNQTQHAVTGLQGLGNRLDQLSGSLSKTQLDVNDLRGGSVGDELEQRLRTIEAMQSLATDDASVDERLSQLETQLEAQSETLGQQADAPAASTATPDLSAIEARLDALEGAGAETQEVPSGDDPALTALADRVEQLENSATAEPANNEDDAAIPTLVLERLDGLESELEALKANGELADSTSSTEATSTEALSDETANDLAERLRSLESQVEASFGDRAETVGNESGHETELLERIAALEAARPEDGTAEGISSELETRVSELEQSFSEAEALAERLSAVEQLVPSEDDEGNPIPAVALVGRIDALEAGADTSALEARLQQLEAQKPAKSGGAGIAVLAILLALGAGGFAGWLFTQVGDVRSDADTRLSAHNTSITNHDTTLKTISGQLTTLNTSLASQHDSLQQLSDSISKLEGDLAQANTDRSTQLAAAAASRTGLADQITTLSGLQKELTDLTNTVNGLPDHSETITTLKNQIAAISDKAERAIKAATAASLRDIVEE